MEFQGWNIELPEDYSFEHENNVLSVYNMNAGVGVICFSAYQLPDEYLFSANRELTEFILSIDDTVDINTLNINQSKLGYSSAELVRNGNTYWKVWVYNNQKEVLFISYNCQSSDVNIEKHQIDDIINEITLAN